CNCGGKPSQWRNIQRRFNEAVPHWARSMFGKSGPHLERPQDVSPWDRGPGDPWSAIRQGRREGAGKWHRLFQPVSVSVTVDQNLLSWSPEIGTPRRGPRRKPFEETLPIHPARR